MFKKATYRFKKNQPSRLVRKAKQLTKQRGHYVSANEVLREAIEEYLSRGFPRIHIQRSGFDEQGHISFVDLHDEKFGEAIFFGKGSRHHHGFLNDGKFKL